MSRAVRAPDAGIQIPHDWLCGIWMKSAPEDVSADERVMMQYSLGWWVCSRGGPYPSFR